MYKSTHNSKAIQNACNYAFQISRLVCSFFLNDPVNHKRQHQSRAEKRHSFTYRSYDPDHMSYNYTGTSGTERKLISPYEKASLRHLMASAEPSAQFHGCHPYLIRSVYAFHFLPQLLHTQKDSVRVCFPLVQKPQRIPTGPASIHPQIPLLAEKSFPLVFVSVIIWQL